MMKNKFSFNTEFYKNKLLEDTFIVDILRDFQVLLRRNEDKDKEHTYCNGMHLIFKKLIISEPPKAYFSKSKSNSIITAIHCFNERNKLEITDARNTKTNVTFPTLKNKITYPDR